MKIALGVDQKFRVCPDCRGQMERFLASDPEAPTEVCLMYVCETCKAQRVLARRVDFAQGGGA